MANLRPLAPSTSGTPGQITSPDVIDPAILPLSATALPSTVVPVNAAGTSTVGTIEVVTVGSALTRILPAGAAVGGRVLYLNNAAFGATTPVLSIAPPSGGSIAGQTAAFTTTTGGSYLELVHLGSNAWGIAAMSAPASNSSATALTGKSLLPTNAIVETMPRKLVNSAALGTTSGQLRASLVELAAGTALTSLSFLSGATAMASAAHQWFAVLDVTGKVLAVTSDDLATAWAANSSKTLNLTSQLIIPTTGAYYLGRCVVAGTMPTVSGFSGLATTVAPFVTAGASGQSAPPAVGTTLSMVSAATVDYGYAS